MKGQEDYQDRVDERLDKKLLHEHASLLFGEAFHLAKCIPANGRVKFAEESKESYQGKNDRGENDSNEQDFALVLHFFRRTAAIHDFSASGLNQLSLGGSQDASSLVSGQGPFLIVVLRLGWRSFDSETFSSQGGCSSEVAKTSWLRFLRFRTERQLGSQRAQNSRRWARCIIDEIKLNCSRRISERTIQTYQPFVNSD